MDRAPKIVPKPARRHKISDKLQHRPESEANNILGENCQNVNSAANINVKKFNRSISETKFSKPSWGYHNVDLEQDLSSKNKQIVEELQKNLRAKNSIAKNHNNLFHDGDVDNSIEEEGALRNQEILKESSSTNIQKPTYANFNETRRPYDKSKFLSIPDLRDPNLFQTLERQNTNYSDEIIADCTQHYPKRKESMIRRVIRGGTFRKKDLKLKPSGPKYTTINVKKPRLISDSNGVYRGALFKLVNDKFEMRWCFLRNDFFILYLDNQYKTVCENLPLDTIVSVTLIDDEKYTFKFAGSTLFYFGIISATNRYIFGTTNKDIRSCWLQKIGESLNCKLTNEAYEYEKIGWTYIREGISREWLGAWLLLANRTLYCLMNDKEINALDLRKIKTIYLQEIRDDDVLPHVLEEAPYLLMDCQKVRYSFRSWTSRDTECWYKRIKKANRNGSSLEEQQLNSNDIPVIVEKCTNFIYLYGSVSEGIYRHNGKTSKVTEILAQFKDDAWLVQLTVDRYSEHDVASALKRFFRDLPEPLIPKKEQELLCQIPFIADEGEKIEKYKRAFSSCPEIHYNTIKTVFDHLNFIVSQSKHNQMNIGNIASIWGVTIMNTEADSHECLLEEDQMLHILMADLIGLYEKIFPGNPKEIEQKIAMKKVLDTHLAQPNLNKISHGSDFLIGIYLRSKQGDSCNIPMGPQKTAYQVCSDLSPRINLPVHKLILEEAILDGRLVRPIHYTERVLDVTLRWTNWEDDDKKDNYIILSPISNYNAYISGYLKPIEGELKFADGQTNKFKTFGFSISSGKLNCYKNLVSKVTLFSWKIEDIVWYLGHEKKRPPPTNYTVTIFKRNEQPIRTKTNPYIGYVLAFADEASRILWVGTLMKSAYPQGYLPLPQYVKIMDI